MGNSLKRSGGWLTSAEPLEVPGILPKDLILYIMNTILEGDIATAGNLRRTCKYYYHLMDTVEWYKLEKEIYPLLGEYHCAVIATAKFQNVAYFARYHLVLQINKDTTFTLNGSLEKHRSGNPKWIRNGKVRLETKLNSTVVHLVEEDSSVQLKVSHNNLKCYDFNNSLLWNKKGFQSSKPAVFMKKPPSQPGWKVKETTLYVTPTSE